MLSESAARWLLVLHTAIGVAAVAAVTHLVMWTRGYLRGQFGRHPAARRFAWIALALHAAAVLAGGVLYPTYKVEVRAAYLENAGAVIAADRAHDRELARLAERERVAPPEPAATGDRIRRAAQAARWFDVKEHWAALGLIGSAALALVMTFWDPRRDGRALAPVVVALAVVIAGTVWLAAIIGVLTTSWRAV